MIDPATGWFEMCETPDKSACAVMDAFDKEWLRRCPRPKCVGMDGGAEFLAEFQETLDNCGCARKVTAPFNPQGNSIVERTHQVIGDALRTFELEELDLDEDDPFGPFLAAAPWVTQSAHHATLEASPGQLVFGRDVLMGVSLTLIGQELLNKI